MIKLPNFVENNNNSQPTWLIIAALVLAVPLGLGVGLFPLPFALMGGVVIGLAVVWWMIKSPDMTASFFWIAISMQFALFSFVIRGLYYPIYAIMFLNILLLAGQGRFKASRVVLALYVAFLLTVLQSLFSVETQINFDTWQQIFIYVVGLLVLLQFTSEKALKMFPYAQMFATLAISLGVISSAVQVGFSTTGRGGLDADANVVSALVALGIIPMFTKLISPRSSLWMRLLMLMCMGVGLYASLLLASRGGIITIAMAFFFIILRVIFKPKRYMYLAIGLVITFLVLLSLPGSSSVFERFSGSDLSSFNDRLPLWQAGFFVLSNSSAAELFLGNGFEASSVVANATISTLTSIHNAYLQLVLDYGIIGLGLFLSLHLYVLFQCWRYDDETSLHALGTIVALLFFDLTGTVPDEFFYWVVLGFTVAVASVRAEATEKSKPKRNTYATYY